MNILLQFQVSIYSLIILSIFYVYIRASKIETFTKQILRYTSFIAGIGIISEVVSWVFDGNTVLYLYLIEYISNFILFILAPVMAGLFLSYVDLKIHKNRQRIIKCKFYQYTSFITLFILIINFFTPLYFVVDTQTGIFHASQFSYFSNIILGLNYAYMFYLIHRYYKVLNKSEIIVFSFIFLMPFVGVIVQLFNAHFENLVFLKL